MINFLLAANDALFLYSSMKFSKAQLLQFGADDGAWSVVTTDERDNSQITIASGDGEAEVAVTAIGESNIPRQSSEHRIPVSIIRRDGENTTGALTINFPKAEGHELRIYRNVNEGFDYEAGDVWFIFRKDSELTVGSMPKAKWDRMIRADEEDDKFQTLISEVAAGDESSAISYHITTGGIKISRSQKLSLLALANSGYQCEFDPTTKLFIAKSTGFPFVEAHHFIPLSAQSLFSTSLDQGSNIVALAPHWHRAIHHAEDNLVVDILSKLAESPTRQGFMDELELSFDDLRELYAA